MPKGKNFQPRNKEEAKIYSLFLKSKNIKRFLDRCKKTARRNYKPYIRDFFIFIKKNPDEYLIDMDTILEREKLIDYRKNIENDIISYVKYLLDLDKQPSPNTYALIKASISKLLKTNNIVLSDIFWDDLKSILPKKEPITVFEIPTLEQLESIINKLDPQGKAIFLTQFSSGSRIEEILNIRIEDLELNHEFPRFIIRYDDSKNGKYSIKRASPEAKKWIKEYLKNRDNWLITKNNRSKGKGRTGLEGRLFPMSKQNAIDKWNNALKKSQLYKKDHSSGLATMGTHTLRKLFRKQCKKAEQTDFGRWISNHGRNIDNTYIYDNFNPKEIDEEYSKVVKHLIVLGKTDVTEPEVRKLKNELAKVKKELTEKREDLDFSKSKINNLNSRLKDIERLLKANIKDNIDPFSPSELTKEQKELEEKIENELISKKEAELKANLKPDEEIVYIDSVPYLRKKPNKKERSKIKKTIIDEFFKSGSKEQEKFLNWIKWLELSPEEQKKTMEELNKKRKQ